MRKLFQQLSQYYPRAENQGPWSSSQLLSVGENECDQRVICDIPLKGVFFPPVVKDLEESNENIGPYDEAPLSASP